MNKNLEPFDGQVMRLTPRVAQIISARRDIGCFKELVNEHGQYVQLLAALDGGCMIAIQGEWFQGQEFIVSEHYDRWRVVEQTLSDEIMKELGIERQFPDNEEWEP